MNISEISRNWISASLWDDSSLSPTTPQMWTTSLATSWLSLPNPATPVLPSRCVSNLNVNGSTDSVRTYPMALMLWTEVVIFTPTLCRTPLFLTPCFMGLVGVTDITSSQSFITLRDNGSLLTNHASTPPMGKLLSCSKSFPPRAPPADPTALISWRGIALGFPKPQCQRSSPILVIFPAITLFWWPPHLAMAPSSGTILIWRHNKVVVMTQ